MKRPISKCRSWTKTLINLKVANNGNKTGNNRCKNKKKLEI
jgi:hypothetical protein